MLFEEGKIVREVKMRFIKPVEAADAVGGVCVCVCVRARVCACKKKMNEYAENFNSFPGRLYLPK